MSKFIALFKYDNINYFIQLVGNNKIVFYKEDSNGKISDKLTMNEIKISNIVLRSLQVDINNSVYYGRKRIEGNNYNIYCDKSTHNFFWIPKNNRYIALDNIYLNFQYNNELGLVFSNIQNIFFPECKEMFRKFINIKGKMVLVLVSASLSLNILSGCTVSADKISKADISNPVQSKIDVSAPFSSALIKYKSKKELIGYSFNDIKSVLESNSNLSLEEKSFLYKLQFVFDEYHSYMNMDVIKERLSTLRLDYQKEYFSHVGGHYDYTNNCIVLNGEDFSDVPKSSFLHEFFHVLQDEIQGYGFFCCELSNEFLTREVLIRLYKEGLLDKEEFMHPYYRDKYISGDLDISDENEWLYYINLNSGFSSGYSDYMGLYYVLAQIITKDALLDYQFNPLHTEKLKTALLNISENQTLEEVERANNLINAINELRQYDLDNNCYIYLKDEGEILRQLDYYFKIVKGKSISEDLVLCVSLINENYRDFGIYSYTYDTREFLQTKGIYDLGLSTSFTFLMGKTFFSDAQGESMIIYDDLNVLVINEDLENEYTSYFGSSVTR